MQFSSSAKTHCKKWYIPGGGVNDLYCSQPEGGDQDCLIRLYFWGTVMLSLCTVSSCFSIQGTIPFEKTPSNVSSNLWETKVSVNGSFLAVLVSVKCRVNWYHDLFLLTMGSWQTETMFLCNWNAINSVYLDMTSFWGPISEVQWNTALLSLVRKSAESCHGETEPRGEETYRHGGCVRNHPLTH